MTTDTPGRSPDGWLTLTEVATRTGYTRDAIRQRVRRGVLRATKGNDGVLRVDAGNLADIPPPVMSGDNPGQDDGDALVAALSVLNTTLNDQGAAMHDLRTTVDMLRTALDKATSDRLVDHGRAERAEARSARKRPGRLRPRLGWRLWRRPWSTPEHLGWSRWSGRSGSDRRRHTGMTLAASCRALPW